MPTVKKFCTYKFHYKGTKVFNLQMKKPNTLIEINEEIHKYHTINFSYSHASKKITKAQAVALLAIMGEQ